MAVVINFARLIFIFAAIAGCVSNPVSERSNSSQPFHLAIVGFKLSAPIDSLSALLENPPQGLDEKTEKQLLKSQIQQIEQKASDDLKLNLEKTGLFKVTLVPTGFAGTKRGEKPTSEQIQQIQKHFQVDGVFYGEIPWYGKTHLLYPLLFTVGDMASETLILGLLTQWSSPILLANAGLEVLTNAPLWFGGAYLFGFAFRPVSVEGTVLYSDAQKEEWSESAERVISQQELKKYSKEQRGLKENQLNSSLKSSVEGLANAMAGIESEVDHLGSINVFFGAANLSTQGQAINLGAGGFATDISLQNGWSIGAAFVLTLPDRNKVSLGNFDLTVKTQIGHWNLGLLAGLGVKLYADHESEVEETTYFGYGLTTSYTWDIPHTSLALGPQMDLIRVEVGRGILQWNSLLVIKFGFL